MHESTINVRFSIDSGLNSIKKNRSKGEEYLLQFLRHPKWFPPELDPITSRIWNWLYHPRRIEPKIPLGLGGEGTNKFRASPW